MNKELNKLSLIKKIYTKKHKQTERHRDTNRLKMRGCKKIFHANENQEKTGKVTFISDKTDFKIKNVKRDNTQ